jgi:LemA protein
MLVVFFHPGAAPLNVNCIAIQGACRTGGDADSAVRAGGIPYCAAGISAKGKTRAPGPVGKNASQPDIRAPLAMKEQTVPAHRAETRETRGLFVGIPPFKRGIGPALRSGHSDIAGPPRLKPQARTQKKLIQQIVDTAVVVEIGIRRFCVYFFDDCRRKKYHDRYAPGKGARSVIHRRDANIARTETANSLEQLVIHKNDFTADTGNCARKKTGTAAAVDPASFFDYFKKILYGGFSMSKGIKTLLITVGVILVIVFSLYSFFGGNYNKMVSMQEDVNNQWAQVQNQYQRRLDLIPNLVATVQGYAKHESDVFTNIAEARSKAGGVMNVSNDVLNNPESFARFQKAQGELGSALQRLLVVTENYPELKANANFMALQDQLEGTENRITIERQRFNDAVKLYNVFIKQFPRSFIANMSGFREKAYFTADEGASKAPTVTFK